MKTFRRLVKLALVVYALRPLIWLFFGVGRGQKNINLPDDGPAVIFANHNSHLDPFFLISLMNTHAVRKTRVVVAADYFLANPFRAFLYRALFEMIPIQRGTQNSGSTARVLSEVYSSLEQGDIIIIYPEGTRGMPEQLNELKHGISKIAERFPHVPFVPIFMKGVGKSMPKGSAVPVPFCPEIEIGEPMFWSGKAEKFMDEAKGRLLQLSKKAFETPWK